MGPAEMLNYDIRVATFGLGKPLNLNIVYSNVKVLATLRLHHVTSQPDRKSEICPCSSVSCVNRWLSATLWLTVSNATRGYHSFALNHKNIYLVRA